MRDRDESSGLGHHQFLGSLYIASVTGLIDQNHIELHGFKSPKDIIIVWFHRHFYLTAEKPALARGFDIRDAVFKWNDQRDLHPCTFL